MKYYFPLATLLLALFVLAGCATTRNTSPYINMDLARENWPQYMQMNPRLWYRGMVDEWFYNGDANRTEREDRDLPMSAALSTMNVKAGNFTEIKIDGDYQVQIYGTTGPNKVTVFGPNQDVRNVIIEPNGHILCLKQVKGPCDMRKVIVRIGVHQLNKLSHNGCGTVQVVNVKNWRLCLSEARGRMFLKGNYNLANLSNQGGVVSIAGVNTPDLEIYTDGIGTTNIAGPHVGVRAIRHHGVNDINIVGANSPNGLFIGAEGGGNIKINGPVNLTEIKVRDNVGIFANSVNSKTLYTFSYGNSKIHLMGNVCNLYTQANGASLFFGRYLCVNTAYIRALDASHVNVSARYRIFASATQNASIYSFGSPGIMTQFASGNGTILPIFKGAAPYCKGEPPPIKKEEGKEARYKELLGAG